MDLHHAPPHPPDLINNLSLVTSSGVTEKSCAPGVLFINTDVSRLYGLAPPREVQEGDLTMEEQKLAIEKPLVPLPQSLL